MNLFQFSLGPGGPTLETKFTISCEFGPVQVKWWCHMFSNMKKEEYMEYELPGITRLKVVAKNIRLGLWAPNTKLFLQCDVSFWRNIQSFWTKLLHLSVFLVKQYSSLIYVKEKLLLLVNWAFPFVAPQGPFLCSKLWKYFMDMRVNIEYFLRFCSLFTVLRNNEHEVFVNNKKIEQIYRT